MTCANFRQLVHAVAYGMVFRAGRLVRGDFVMVPTAFRCARWGGVSSPRCCGRRQFVRRDRLFFANRLSALLILTRQFRRRLLDILTGF